MARAAAKRNQRAKQATRTRAHRPGGGGGPKPVEQTLFFTRLRTHAKWVFVLLALVFAGGFVFFGVGSGSSGISDILSGNLHLFGRGSSGPSIDKAQKRIAKNPKDAAAYRDLARAYELKKDDILAIQALENYARLRPKNTGALNELAGLYETRARTQLNEVQLAVYNARLALPSSFGPPPNTPLGRAFAATPDPIQQALYAAASREYSTAASFLQQTYTSLENVYKRISAADPTDPSSLILYAQAAQQARDTTTALATYRKFLKQFPDDPNAPSARLAIRKLKAAAASSPSG